MASAKIYKDKLSTLNPEHLQVHPTTPQEAQKVIAKFEKIEAFLTAMAKQLVQEVARVESNYQKALKTSSLTGSSLWFGNKDIIAQKKILRGKFDEKREELLASYHEVGAINNQFLAEYRASRQQLLAFIEQELGQKPKRTTATLGGLLLKPLSNSTNKTLNYKTYLKSTGWKKKAEAAKVRAGNRCQGCNKPRSEVQLEAHHRTYERIGHELPGDITVLCRNCHQSIEESKAKVSLETKLKSPDCGVCIRCGSEIEFNPHRPLCPDCYKIWRKNSNNYSAIAQYCHVCSKKNDTSIAKPMCLDCYKEVKILQTN